MVHGETNPTDPNYYWDANFNNWVLKPGSPTGGANLTLAQALAGTSAYMPTVLNGGGDQYSPLTSAPIGTPAPSGQPPLVQPGGSPATSLASTSSGSQPANMGMPTQPATHTAGAGMRLERNGEVYFKTDPGEIGQLIQQGFQVRDGNDPNGQLYTPKSFQGGYLVKSGQYWVPIDTLLNGRMTIEQATALKQGGFAVDPDVVLPNGTNAAAAVTGTPANTQSGVGNAGAYGNAEPGTVLGNGDLQDKLNTLMQLALNQGAAGQKAYNNILGDFQNAVAYNQKQTEKTSAQRDALVSALLGGSFDASGNFTPSSGGLFSNLNDIAGRANQGLDPLTLASLNQQAIEGPQRDYQQQVEALKTSLAQRGAYGGGDTPGDFGAILGGYSPLLTSRDTTREGLLQNVSFANQNQKNTNLQAALGAMGQQGGLLSSLGNLYNPNVPANTTQSALANALSGIGAQQNSAFQGLNAANQAGNSLGVLQSNSGNSGLWGALLSAGAQLGGDLLKYFK